MMTLEGISMLMALMGILNQIYWQGFQGNFRINN